MIGGDDRDTFAGLLSRRAIPTVARTMSDLADIAAAADVLGYRRVGISGGITRLDDGARAVLA